MKVEQIYTKCLSQGSYYIECNKEVAIIDPIREVETYVEKAKKSGSKIKYIFETHIHADFISGHLNLAKKTGAKIIYGPKSETTFNKTIASDYEKFKLGNSIIVAIHTPGHTIESTTYLLKDTNGKDHAIFTGDTLFLGDVGRPDLSQISDLDNKDLASMLYDSLRNKIMILNDDVIVYPGHGQGTSCGKDLSSETIGTLGDQKKTNYALRDKMTKEEFVKEVLTGLLDPPKYFPSNVELNKNGYLESQIILKESLNALDANKVEELIKEVILLDVRNENDFAESHIPGSIFIGLDGRFAPWVGELLEDIKKPIILLAPKGREEEAITRLSRVGFDNIKGYLKGGIKSWIELKKQTNSIENIKAQDFMSLNSKFDINILDVRSQNEYLSGSVDGSLNIPLINLTDNLDKLNSNKRSYIYCKGGYRSMIASSILNSKGINDITNIIGGYDSISLCIE
ncbi:MAG: MBL fold metallo-hydrolase [Cryomorphaceae bacterium MED-G11]|nr:MAG: MBL fold metallo-hydrolase [Cryomorphaceae bacterium MED-G11]